MAKIGKYRCKKTTNIIVKMRTCFARLILSLQLKITPSI
jgi:hypothetical protein